MQTSVTSMKRQKITDGSGLSNRGTDSSGLYWESHEEPVGAWAEGGVITTQSLLEQIKTTKDLTDYLWYVTR